MSKGIRFFIVGRCLGIGGQTRGFCSSITVCSFNLSVFLFTWVRMDSISLLRIWILELSFLQQVFFLFANFFQLGRLLCYCSLHGKILVLPSFCCFIAIIRHGEQIRYNKECDYHWDYEYCTHAIIYMILLPSGKASDCLSGKAGSSPVRIANLWLPEKVEDPSR